MVQELTRLPGWRARLHAEIEAHRRERFSWGARDCVLGLGAGVVEAITGMDLRPSVSYDTAAGALRALRAAGHESLGDAVATLLPEIHPAMARDGDLALIDEGELGGLAVFSGGTLIVLTLDGLGVRERAVAKRAYRVG